MNSYGQIVLGAGVTAGFHPVSYVKTLIQIGYEPIAPKPSTSIFGRKVLVYPGLFKYLSVIKKEDGFFGMYRGLGARLVGGVVGSMVTNAVSVELRGEVKKSRDTNSEIDGDEDAAADQIVAMLKDNCYETVSRCTGVLIAHPFHVIMIRQMAQFVGKETEYRNIFSSAGEIYDKDGIWGFFAGLVPRLFGEVLTIWLANTLAYILNQYLIPKSEGAARPDHPVGLEWLTSRGAGFRGSERRLGAFLPQPRPDTLTHRDMIRLAVSLAPTYMKSYTSALSSLMVTQVTYPFMLVSNVMAVNNTSLRAGNPPISPVYSSWGDCWRTLSRENALKRGSSVFMRYYKGPVTYGPGGSIMAAKYA